MRRFTISLPLFSIVPMGIGMLMLVGFLAIFNALRFIQCSPWASLQKPPGDADALLGTPLKRLYVRTTNNAIYCLAKEQWSKCTLPPYALQPDEAPAWLAGRLEANFQTGPVLQVIRAGSISDVTYYALLADRRLLACSTNFTIEVENTFQSSLFVWLLIPTGGILWCSAWFINIVIKYGQPTYWDFSGRGRRVK